MMLADLERALGIIKQALSVEPERVATADAAKVFDVFLEIERAVVAGKTLFAGRAAEAGLWREQGHRTPASWVAELSGSGLGEAIGLLETGERLQSLPQTTEALRRGALSASQLKEIVATASGDPSSEGALLEVAGRSGLKGLKDECRRVKARGARETEARERYEQIRKNRSLVMWTDSDGVGRVEARLTPDALGRFSAAIQSEANAIFAESRKAGHHESPVAYAADALVALVTGTGVSRPSARSGASSKSPRPTTMMHLRVDLAALRRGRLEDGETCEIPGVGPVPLATAVNELGNSMLKVIVSDGVDVTTVSHLGRAVPARIQSALVDRDETCVVPGCEVAKGLEIDHYQVGFAQDGPTELWNLCRLCHWHHYLKTNCGYAITGGPGSWEWEAPVSEHNPVLTS